MHFQWVPLIFTLAQYIVADAPFLALAGSASRKQAGLLLTAPINTNYSSSAHQHTSTCLRQNNLICG